MMFISFILLFITSHPAQPEKTWLHDIHISLCELRWNEDASSFEVSIKIFIDDLELALSREGHTGLSIGTDKESEEADELIMGYLEKHFSMDIDGKGLLPVFVGKEISEDFQAIWCYLEVPGKVNQARKFTLRNDILLDLYDDQRNILDIRMSESHKAYTILQPGRSTWSYTY